MALRIITLQRVAILHEYIYSLLIDLSLALRVNIVGILLYLLSLIIVKKLVESSRLCVFFELIKWGVHLIKVIKQISALALQLNIRTTRRRGLLSRCVMLVFALALGAAVGRDWLSIDHDAWDRAPDSLAQSDGLHRGRREWNLFKVRGRLTEREFLFGFVYFIYCGEHFEISAQIFGLLNAQALGLAEGTN